jgi:hypothetical protein
MWQYWVQWFPYSWTLKEAPGLLKFVTIPTWSELYLQATDTWHQWVICWNTRLGSIVGQMLKCQLWQCVSLLCTICYQCIMRTCLIIQNAVLWIRMFLILFFLNFCKVMKPLTVKSVSTIDFSPLSYAWIVRVEDKQCKTIMRNESCALFGGVNQGM